jgi:deoxyribose-phosphate aldolase
MDPQQIPVPAVKEAVYEDVAGLIDHTLLRPDLPMAGIVDELQLARRYRVAAVTVRQCDVELASRTLDGSPVKPASVCAWPYGWQTTSAKLYETRDLLRRGAREIEIVVPTARLLSREFQHIASELSQLVEACRKENAILKAGLETNYLTDELKIIACRCCETAEVSIVVVRESSELAFFRKYLPDEIALKIPGQTLDQVIEAKAAGAARLSSEAIPAILDEWKSRLATPSVSTL